MCDMRGLSVRPPVGEEVVLLDADYGRAGPCEVQGERQVAERRHIKSHYAQGVLCIASRRLGLGSPLGGRPEGLGDGVWVPLADAMPR